jgi:flagellar hook-associated protein 3 FlgL
MKANIIWGENPNDPGPYIILGFELLEEAYIDQPTSSQKGDSFSFATGSKTFLDHRNSDGQVVGVTYTGSDENSEFYIGKDTKISSFLDAEDGNTAELANVLESLIELRDGLSEDSPSELSRRVQLVENELIQREDEVVDKLGELSSLLIRMESVRAYDEDYHLQLEQRLAKDLDIDLSQAIMELTRVSTAYQAAMQVGAQLLNTSLLNYI